METTAESTSERRHREVLECLQFIGEKVGHMEMRGTLSSRREAQGSSRLVSAWIRGESANISPEHGEGLLARLRRVDPDSKMTRITDFQ